MKRKTKAELEIELQTLKDESEKNADTVEKLKRYRKTQNTNYNTNTVDRINITVPKGRKADISNFAKQHDLSVNAFVSDLVLGVVDGRLKVTENDSFEKQ